MTVNELLIAVLTALLVGAASYRTTRFLLFDTLIDGIRNKFYTFVANRTKPALLWNKLLDLTTCSWCAGFWVTLTLYSLFIQTSPHNFGVYEIITVLAATAVQGSIHAYEPGDE